MEKVFDKNDKFGTINSIRQLLIEELKDYEGEPIKLDLNEISGIDGLESLIFKDYVDSNKKNVKIIAFSYDVLRKLDLSNVSFDGVAIDNYDFTGLTGVKINPEKVWEKDLINCIFNGVEFIGGFKGCRISRCDFTGSKGAVIDPYMRVMSDCKFSGVRFLDNWVGTDVSRCDFTGSTTLMTAPRDIDMTCTKLQDVKFAWKIQNCRIDKCDFRGSEGAVIFPEEWKEKSAFGTNFEGVTFRNGWFDGWDIRSASFKNSVGALIDLDMIEDKDVSNTDLTDAYFGPVGEDIKINNTVCNGMSLEEYLVSKEVKEGAYVKVKSVLEQAKNK